MTMTYTSILADLPRWANDESTEFAADLTALMELGQDRCHDALIELEQFKTTSSGTFTPGGSTVSRPSNAIFFRSFRVVVGSSTVILQRKDETDLIEMYGTAQGAPRYYAESGGTLLRIAPVPDSNYAYTITYSRKLPYLALTTNETNWLTDYAPNALRYALMVEASLRKRHDDGVQMWLGAFGRAINDIRKRHGLNERDDFRAGKTMKSVDNQGDDPPSMGQRMRAAAQQQGG